MEYAVQSQHCNGVQEICIWAYILICVEAFVSVCPFKCGCKYALLHTVYHCVSVQHITCALDA